MMTYDGTAGDVAAIGRSRRSGKRACRLTHLANGDSQGPFAGPGEARIPSKWHICPSIRLALAETLTLTKDSREWLRSVRIDGADLDGPVFWFYRTELCVFMHTFMWDNNFFKLLQCWMFYGNFIGIDCILVLPRFSPWYTCGISNVYCLVLQN